MEVTTPFLGSIRLLDDDALDLDFLLGSAQVALDSAGAREGCEGYDQGCDGDVNDHYL